MGRVGHCATRPFAIQMQGCMETLRIRGRRVVPAQVAPVLPLLLIQLLAGAWILPQLSFFPIYLEEQLHYSPFTLSAVIAAGQVAGLVAALYGGRLTDTLGSKRVLVLGLMGAAVASLVFLMELPLLVVGLWLLGGAAGSLQTLGGSSYLTRTVDPLQLGVLSALYALSMTLGGAIGSPIAGQVLDAAGFQRYGLIGLSVVAITVLVAAIWLPPQRAGGEAQPGGRVSTLSLAHRPIVQLLMGLRFLPTIYYGMAMVLVPLMIHDLAGNKTTVALYGTASLVVASLAQLVAGRAAIGTAIGRRRSSATPF